jgi:hypothetical protein
MNDLFGKGFNEGYCKGWIDCQSFIKKQVKKDRTVNDIWKEAYGTD